MDRKQTERNSNNNNAFKGRWQPGGAWAAVLRRQSAQSFHHSDVSAVGRWAAQEKAKRRR